MEELRVSKRMNSVSLAAKLDGREYGNEITKEEEREALKSDLVVVFGYSDDNVELRGAIDDEVGAYEGTTLYITKTGLLEDCESECPNFLNAKQECDVIEAVYGEDGYTWQFKTSIPHYTFDVMEDGEKFCKGIVFKLGTVCK